jgi:hypothetical protein
MCDTCLFEVHKLSLLSTKYVALRTSYNIKIHHINTPCNPNIIKQDKQIKKCWFNILDFLWYCDKRDMAKDYELQEIDFESLVEKVKWL